MISNCSTFDGKTVHFSVAIYTMWTSPGKNGPTFSLLPHFGIKVNIDTVPACEFAGVPTRRAWNLVRTNLRHFDWV